MFVSLGLTEKEAGNRGKDILPAMPREASLRARERV